MNKKLLTSLIFLSVAVGFSNPALAGISLKQRFNDFINNTNIAPDIAIPSENGDIQLIQLSEQDFDTAAEEEESTKVASNKFLNFFKPKSKEQQEENNVEVKAGSDIDVVQVDDESKDIEKLKPAEENPKVSEEKEKKKFRLFGRKDKNNKEEVKKTTEETPVIQPRDAFEGEQVVEGAVTANKVVTVDDCVKIALENNPRIMSQMMSKDIYQNKIAQAWANYFPTLNLGVSYSRNDMMVTNFRFPMQQYNLYNTPNVGFDWLLFDFGKTSAQAGVARKTYEAAGDTLQENINDIICQVKTAYYNLLFAMQQVNVYEDTVMNYEVHLKQAQAYYDIGTKAKIDVSTAKYNLDNAQLSLIQAKNTVKTAFANLNNAMGVPEFSDYNISERLDSKKYEVQFEDVLNKSYEQRPELLAAKKKMEGSKILIKASKYAFLPDLRGVGNFSQGGKTPDTDYGYQIGAQLSYTGTNLYLLKKQLDEAKLTYKKDQADYETARQNVYLQVKQAYIDLMNAQESVPVARSSMMVAKEQYELASGRYKVGMGDAIELKDAETTYRNSQLSYYNTLMQYNIAAANLEKVVGAPIDYVEGEL